MEYMKNFLTVTTFVLCCFIINVEAKAATSEPSPTFVPEKYDYPRYALRDRAKGKVTMKFNVNSIGQPTTIKVVEANPKRMFDKYAKRLLKIFRFDNHKNQNNLHYTMVYDLDENGPLPLVKSSNTSTSYTPPKNEVALNSERLKSLSVKDIYFDMSYQNSKAVLDNKYGKSLDDSRNEWSDYKGLSNSYKMSTRLVDSGLCSRIAHKPQYNKFAAKVTKTCLKLIPELRLKTRKINLAKHDITPKETYEIYYDVNDKISMFSITLADLKVPSIDTLKQSVIKKYGEPNEVTSDSSSNFRFIYALTNNGAQLQVIGSFKEEGGLAFVASDARGNIATLETKIHGELMATYKQEEKLREKAVVDF